MRGRSSKWHDATAEALWLLVQRKRLTIISQDVEVVSRLRAAALVLGLDPTLIVVEPVKLSNGSCLNTFAADRE